LFQSAESKICTTLIDEYQLHVALSVLLVVFIPIHRATLHSALCYYLPGLCPLNPNLDVKYYDLNKYMN